MIRVAGLVLALVPGALLGQGPAAPARARVSYVAAGTAYLEAGREEGLRDGHEVRVVRGGRAVARLIVTALASHRAACSVATAGFEPVVGDTVEFTPVPPDPVAGGPSSPASAAGRPAAARGRVHGRIGLRYLAIRPIEGPGFTQPAVDLRLDGVRLGGTPFGLILDVRARRTWRTAGDGSSEVVARDAVYQAAVRFRPAGPARVTVGRQYLPTVSSVSLFDGALVEYQASRLGAGVFAGSEPDPATMGWSSDLRDLGIFLEARSAPGAATRLAVSGGAIGSYARGGAVNREFGFLQASLATRQVSLYLAQELDLNRGWKAEAGEPALTFTSTFLSLLARPSDAVTLSAGLDNRRNVRLYRDFVNPEIAFDDSFRRGVWAGVSLAPGRHIRVGLDGRSAFGQDSLSRTASGTLSLGVDRLTRAGLGLRSRHTRYRAPGRTGWLHSGAMGAHPAAWFGLEVSGGHRSEAGGPGPRRTSWLGADLDLLLGRSVYLLVSLQREQGDLAAGDQLYAGLSWRF